MPNPRRRPPRRAVVDAIELLKRDHISVKKLLIAFDELRKRDHTDAEKRAVAQRICLELTVHARIEDELFYPAARQATGDNALIDQADVEHASARELISQIAVLKPGDQQYDAKVVVLGEYIDHHVEVEHTQIFPKVRRAGLDLRALGARLAERKNQLLADANAMMGLEDESADPVGRPEAIGRS